MKKLVLLAIACAALTIGARIPHASGPVGIYGIVEKVVLERSDLSATQAARVRWYRQNMEGWAAAQRQRVTRVESQAKE